MYIHQIQDLIHLNVANLNYTKILNTTLTAFEFNCSHTY